MLDRIEGRARSGFVSADALQNDQSGLLASTGRSVIRLLRADTLQREDSVILSNHSGCERLLDETPLVLVEHDEEAVAELAF